MDSVNPKFGQSGVYLEDKEIEFEFSRRNSLSFIEIVASHDLCIATAFVSTRTISFDLIVFSELRSLFFTVKPST